LNERYTLFAGKPFFHAHWSLCYNGYVSILDIGCDDFERASVNRLMVERGENLAGYKQIESVLKGWPHRKPLPGWITPGKLPRVGRHEEVELGNYGLHVLEE